MNMSELEANDQYPFMDECRNAFNDMKCSRCENNPFKYEAIEKYGEGEAHDRMSKAYYNFRDNYDPL